MLISTKQKHNALKNRRKAFELTIRDHELEVVQQAKYFELVVDCSSDWKEQIKAVSNSFSRAVGFLNTLNPFSQWQA